MLQVFLLDARKVRKDCSCLYNLSKFGSRFKCFQLFLFLLVLVPVKVNERSKVDFHPNKLEISTSCFKLWPEIIHFFCLKVIFFNSNLTKFLFENHTIVTVFWRRPRWFHLPKSYYDSNVGSETGSKDHGMGVIEEWGSQWGNHGY